MTFSERLHIPWWWALVGLGLVASLAGAVIAYVPGWLGVLFTLLTATAVGAGLGLYSFTLLTVDHRWFRAGRYRLERRYIASATPLTGEQAAAAVGPDVDHRAFLFTRPYVGDLVRIDLNDPADPHPYWLVSTRRARQLADALQEDT